MSPVRPYVTHSFPVESLLLRGNRLGDPYERPLIVLAPEGREPSAALPAIWMLPGHGSSQGGFLASDPWREGLPQRLGRLTASGALPPALFVLPDLFTRLGGSQSLDSSLNGPYERYLWEELKPALEARFQVKAHGIAGHSSGGYGAFIQALRHPEIVRAVACHAGDMLFEYAYLPDFPKAANRLRAEGGVEKLVRGFDAAIKKQDSRWFAAINILAMAAAYSPNEAAPGGVDLPFDLETCQLRPDVWERWLAADPVRLVEQPGHQQTLKRLALLFIDAGSRDEFNLQWGARALTRRLGQLGVPHTYEEFDDGHMGTAYRFDRSLPLLAQALLSDTGN
jgi:S-formylglutathione hydrolase FrmB